MTAQLSVQEVDFAYGRLQVLFGVSFEVNPGEAVALVGTNGAGKSTLLRVVAGLERPASGSVELDGVDIGGIAAHRLVARGVVLVRGGRADFPELTVAENMEMQALTVRGRPDWLARRRELVLEAFPALRLRWSRRAGVLSGGEQQQLVLAKALLLEPKLLCIDELSLGLAPVVVQTLLEAVRLLRAEGTTLVLVEQSLNLAAELCDRAVFLEKGHVRFEGRVTDLLERDDIARAVFLGAPASAEASAAARNGSRAG